MLEKEGKEEIEMRTAIYKATILAVMVAAVAFAGLAYAAGAKTDTVVTPLSGSGESLPWVNALYVSGQGPNFELANYWYYRPYYRSYGYGYHSFFRHHHRHPFRFGHFRHFNDFRHSHFRVY